ncbi:MAG: hypothetical protein HRT42_13585, partial [Campylobacteraceae bacterium]|nr:hypothetical protein [Campylobacteraceae bacterium]
MKENAKEYLKEFASSQPNWLKALIYEVIETNADISHDIKNEIFNSLKNDTSLTINEPTINDDNSDKEIYLTSLEHIKGVNALAQNQTIKFHNNVTILYGLNGAGKSSYFKILNEIVGGNQKKEVFSNIYLSTPQSIDVKILFREKTGQIQSVNWNGSSRSLEFLNKCKVFDSSYLNGLLTTRKADSTLIQPLGLNLFAYLVVLIDEFKQKLNSESDKKRLEKTKLELKDFRDEIKMSFSDHQVSESIKIKIENLFIFTEDQSKKLVNTKKELEDLKQINIHDKIKLKTNDKIDIDNIKTYLENTHKNIFTFFADIQKELELLIINQEANELAKKQFEILSSIPSSDNLEWKEFIKSGEKYKLKVENSDKICIYCRQELVDENANKLIGAYGKFLKDESEKKLNNSIEQIENLKKKIEKVSVELKIKENIQVILKENIHDRKSKDLHEIIIDINNQFSLEKDNLLEKIKHEDLKIKFDVVNIVDIATRLTSISKTIQIKIDKLSEENTEKATDIEKLEKTINNDDFNGTNSKEVGVIEFFDNEQMNIEPS